MDLRRKFKLKLPPPQICCRTYLAKCKWSTIHLYSTDKWVQSDANTFNYIKCSRICYFFVCLHRAIYHVFKMSDFVTYSCFESCTPLVNGCVDYALFNAVL